MFKTGNCYEPCEKDHEINAIFLQISAILSLCFCNNFLKVVIKNRLGLDVLINTEKNNESKTHQHPL